MWTIYKNGKEGFRVTKKMKLTGEPLSFEYNLLGWLNPCYGGIDPIRRGTHVFKKTHEYGIIRRGSDGEKDIDEENPERKSDKNNSESQNSVKADMNNVNAGVHFCLSLKSRSAPVEDNQCISEKPAIESSNSSITPLPEPLIYKGDSSSK